MNKFKYPLLAGLIAILPLTNGCNYDNLDTLDVTGIVLADDGYTLIEGLRVDSYNVDLTFSDGTRITKVFPDEAVALSGMYTDINGEFRYIWDGFLEAYEGTGTSCYHTCIDYDAYGYCDWYVEDCDSYDYVEWYDVHEITKARAQMTYRYGSSFITTLGYSALREKLGDTFVMIDEFITPFYSGFSATELAKSIASGSAIQKITTKGIKGIRNFVTVRDEEGNESQIPTKMSKPKVTRFADIETLNAEQMAKVEKTRKGLAGLRAKKAAKNAAKNK